MATPPQGYLKLIAMVKKKFPGLSFQEATAIIVKVKRINGGVLKGLNVLQFMKLAGKAVKEKVNVEKHDDKEERYKDSRRSKTCPICFVIFSKRQAKERHMIVHKKEEEPVIVDDVDDELSDIDVNSEGLDKQKGDEKFVLDFKCEVCGKAYSHQGSLKRHMMSDHGDMKTFSCDMCELKFKRKDNVYAHKRMVHNAHNINFDALQNENEHSLFCKQCGESFEHAKKFEAHIVLKVCKDKVKISGVDGKEKYECDLCERSYKHKKSLLAHLEWKHRSKKTYKCEECNVEYTHNSSLVRHMKKLH